MAKIVLVAILSFLLGGSALPMGPVQTDPVQELGQFEAKDEPEEPPEVNSYLKVDEAYEQSKLASGRKDNIDERGLYLEGDMVVSPEQFMTDKAGIVGNQYRWPKGIVPYQIDTAFSSSEQAIIMQGIQEIESKTCIRFQPKGSSNLVNYVFIKRGAPNSGCFSDVGMQQGKFNNVNLQPGNPGCMFMGIAAHELIHAIGWYHEQSRTDRDSYVTINWSNIPTSQSFNFNKFTAAQVNPFGVAYDYGSIMHYSAYAFAINTKSPTITPLQNIPLSTMGQRNGLSPSDAQKINNMYKGICTS